MASALFSPFVTGPLLAGITYAPEATGQILAQIAEKLPEQILNYAPSLATTTTALQVLFGLGVVRTANRALNCVAHNSWRVRAAKGWDWPREIAVVTGGSAGIGFCIVERLLALGMKVAVLDVQELPKTLQGRPNVTFYRCDVTSGEEVKSVADAVRRDLGNPSILINNAGITRPLPIMEMPESYLKKIFGVNCIALWLTTQQFLPSMVEQDKGHIITLASIASYVALARGADYSATKAAALSFHEALACELKHNHKAPNVLTTCVHPSFAKTDLLSDVTERLEKSGVSLLTPEQIADSIVAQIKSRRGGQLYLPGVMSLLSGLRGWPTWLQEILRDSIGRDAFS